MSNSRRLRRVVEAKRRARDLSARSLAEAEQELAELRLRRVEAELKREAHLGATRQRLGSAVHASELILLDDARVRHEQNVVEHARLEDTALEITTRARAELELKARSHRRFEVLEDRFGALEAEEDERAERRAQDDMSARPRRLP